MARLKENTEWINITQEKYEEILKLKKKNEDGEYQLLFYLWIHELETNYESVLFFFYWGRRMTLPKSIYQWSVEDVIHWLNENHFETIVQDFKDHLIDGKALSLLDHDDVQELIKRIGPRVKFRAKLSQLLISRGMENNLGRKQASQAGYNINGSYTNQGYKSSQMYTQSALPQYPQQFQYGTPISSSVNHGNMMQQPPHQNMVYQNFQQPIKVNYVTSQPMNKEQPIYQANGIGSMNMAQPISNVQKQKQMPIQYNRQPMNSGATGPQNFRNLKQGKQKSTPCSQCVQCVVEAKKTQQEKVDILQNSEVDNTDDFVEITKFIEGSGFKKEPVEESENYSQINNGSSGYVNGSVDPSEKPVEGIDDQNNENLDPNQNENDSNSEDFNMGGVELSFEGVPSMVEGDTYPVLDVTIENDEYRLGSSLANNINNNRLGIEAVTNRLALRERAKIFRRSDKKWHVAVNETAYQLVLRDPKLLLRKKDLRLMAECEVRKTYRFAKGKSRSIAIPENKAAAEERKKQKLTKDKIIEMKRQINTEGEEISRRMRQVHMNLTLASQQSDASKTMELREEMHKLSQQQAKLHFTMDELLTKERKLESGVSKILKTPNMPVTSYASCSDNTNSYHMLEINEQTSDTVYVSPEYQIPDSQNISIIPAPYAPPQTTSHSLSPQILQVHVDESGKVTVASPHVLETENAGDNCTNNFPNNSPDLTSEHEILRM